MKALPTGLHLHFDPSSGIAGDMTVGALVDAGVPKAVVVRAVDAMGVPGLNVKFDRRQRGAYVGTGFVVSWPGQPAAKPASARKGRGHDQDHDGDHDGGHDHSRDHDAHDHDHDHHSHDHDHDHSLRPPRSRAPAHSHDDAHRDYAEIRRLLKKADLDADVRALAAEIFAAVAQAESKLHGVSIERIAFHEVGAYDSIADIVGAAAAIVSLAPASISSAPPVLGSGQVRTAHGIVPVPAPATAELLADIPVLAEGRGELTTPTGAAILATVVDRFGALPPLRLKAQGFGPGTRELPDRPNVLRVLLGEPLGQLQPDSPAEAVLLESNIDDMNPQLHEPLLTALLEAGALDAWSTPILMKKGRPALTVSALAAPDHAEAVARAFFENSTTIGLRTLPLGRTVLARSSAKVKTAYGQVAVKLSALDGRVTAATPEFDDCRRLARVAKVPVRAVLTAASAAAAIQFGVAGTPVKG
jgi:pyridinium-3,5-bisthiocarboxylic acid mononucleotide nickel chelatase